jgi:chemotaxis protein methyltransferase CheR
MAITPEAPPLSVPEGLPALLRDLVHENTGTFFDPPRFNIMIEKLSPLARERNCRSLMDYYFILKYGAEDSEWRRVMDVLSVQETYFWREMDQIRALVNVFVPGWFGAGARRLRIWSAACATGEEPYSLVMALLEAGHGALPIEVVGTDASLSALKKAEAGVYRERSFRTLPLGLREKYFKKEGELWRLDPAIVRRVKFECRNLVVKQDIQPFATAPAILCRNVFIYFSQETIRRTVSWFAGGMPEKGYLMVGASESLLKLTTDFSLEEINGAFVYVRRSRGS